MTLERTITTTSERDTRRLAEVVAAALEGETRATVIALDGELGAGKTRFVRGLAGGLGVDMNAITSPTFVVLVEHRGRSGTTLVHMDAWRVRSIEELSGIGWEELLERERTVIAVEWAERIREALPAGYIHIEIAHRSADAREFTITDYREDPRAHERLSQALALYEPSADPLAPHHPEPQRTAACPICSVAVAANAATFPFCSSRCRMADLGRWFGGRYSVSRPVESDEELSE